jgi:hypothetical protein
MDPPFVLDVWSSSFRIFSTTLDSTGRQRISLEIGRGSLREVDQYRLEWFTELLAFDSLLDRFQSTFDICRECLPFIHVPLSFLKPHFKHHWYTTSSPPLTLAFCSSVTRVSIAPLRGASTGRDAPVLFVTSANEMTPSITSPCRFLFCPPDDILYAGSAMDSVRPKSRMMVEYRRWKWM